MIKTHFRVLCILGLLHLLVVGVGALTPIPISYGETSTGMITSLAQVDTYSFTASAGDTIYSRMESSWYNGPRIRLYAPNGTLIKDASGTSAYFTDMTQTLTNTGTYTLLVGDIIGDVTNQNYGLYLQRTNNPGNAEPVAFGETKTGSVTKRAELKNYIFTASAGDTIYSRMESSWYNGPRIRLYAPNGTLIKDVSGSSDYFTEMAQTLTNTGTYTLLVGDITGDATGQNYGLYLQRTNNPGNAEPITFGETKTGSVTKRAEMKNYIFTASAGDTIYSRMESSWYNGPRIRLYSPRGTLIRDVSGSSDYFTEMAQTFTDTGTYTLLVGDITGDATSQNYGLYLQRTNNPSNAEPVAFGETKTGSVTKRAEMKNYIFTASAGDTIYSRMESSWYNGPRIRVFAPNGTMIRDVSGSSDYFTDMTQTLTNTGRYTLLVGDITGDVTNQNYGLFLQRTNNPGNAESITFGETKTGSITKRAEMKNYTFAASAGDIIYSRMDSTWYNGPRIRLYSPHGTLVRDVSGISAYFIDMTQTLTDTGTYTVLAGDVTGDTTTGAYGLLLQLINAPSIIITSPHGGETWQRGTSHTVTWDYAGGTGPYVKIVLIKAGVEVDIIKSNVSIGSGGHGSYVWPISSPEFGGSSSDYKVRVQSISKPDVNGTSDSYFNITSVSSSITVKSPNGNEIWPRGTSQKISWDYTGSPGSLVKIVLVKGSAVVGTVKSSVSIGSGGKGSYTWPLSLSGSGGTGSDYKVRVQSISQPNINDTSDNSFSITLPNLSSITVKSPNGNEIWPRGTSRTISWDYSGSPGSFVKIVLLRGSTIAGTVKSNVSIGSGGKGSYTWPLSLSGSGGTGSDYKVSVQSISQPAVKDMSDGYFSIISAPSPASITVTSPNGGESWQRGTSRTISWDYSGSPGSFVKIVLLRGSTIAGTVKSNVSIGSGGKGSYTWPISSSGSGGTGSDYKVSVQSISQPDVKDMSNSYFNITPAPTVASNT